MSETCPHAWHGGLPVGLLRDCKYVAGHRGMHRDLSGDLAWGGKLTDEELALATALRTRTLPRRQPTPTDSSEETT